jgi:hypothetical protein
MVGSCRSAWKGIGWVLAALVALSCGSGTAFAQGSTGGLRGIVHDSTGGVLAGVTVEAESPARIGGAAVAVTDGEGTYRLENLTVGMYTVTFTLQGFSTIKRTDIRVEVNRSIQVDQQLSVSTVQETVTVTGESPVVDTVHAGTSTTMNQEMLVNIPTSRTQFFDTLAYVPGIKVASIGGSGFNVFGSGTNQNAIMYDGIDVSNPSGGSAYDWPNYDMMEELEVKAVGASAEAKGFQGGAINLVLRSGSNTFKGSASYYGRYNALLANNTPNEQFPYWIDYNHDVGYSYGGPLIKDKFWFQLINQHIRRHETNIGQDPKYDISSVRIWRPYVKVNAKLGNNDDVNFHYNDCRDHWPGTGTRETPSFTTTVEVGYDPVFTSGWNHVFGSATMFEMKQGLIYVHKWNPPQTGDLDTPGVLDNGTGLSSVNARSIRMTRSHNASIQAALSHTASDFIVGTHEFKFGFQYAHQQNNSYDSLTGGRSFFLFNGQPDYALVRSPQTTSGQYQTEGGYLNDNWTVNDRLALNLGFRYDRQFGEVPDAPQLDTHLDKEIGTFTGVPSLIDWRNFSARTGAVVKLDSEGKTVAKVNYGRYPGRLVSGDVSRMSNGQVISNYYGWNPATAQYDTFLRTSVPANSNLIDPDLKNSYSDQIYVGMERQLRGAFGLNVYFVYKKQSEILSVIDTGGVYAPQVFTDTFNGVTQQLTVFNRTTPASRSILFFTNNPDMENNYKTVVVEANKRLSDRWQLLGSYQWQRQRTTTSPNSGDPNGYINNGGRSATDSVHAVRASSTMGLPYGVQLGLRYFFNTGNPYSRVISARLSQGTTTVIAQQVGAYEYPSFHDLRMRLDKAIPMGGARRLRLSLDIFNVFNSAASTSVRNNSTQTVFPFGTLFNVVSPRQGMVGLRFEF